MRKVQLRINSIAGMDYVKVLDAFGGEGLLWDKVAKITGKHIDRFSIDREGYQGALNFIGDSLKVMPSLDLRMFDVIDLDAYGIPSRHIEKIFAKDFKGVVHVTAIQSGMGALPYGFLYRLGYTKGMVKKAHTLFSRNGRGKVLAYLSTFGVGKVQIYSQGRKNYLWFTIA